MSGLGRITQETVEVIGPDQGHARITQEAVEALGPVHSVARVTQLYAEVLAPQNPKQARITQLYAEPLGPPGSVIRVNQLVAEIAQASNSFTGPDNSWKWNQLIGARVGTNWLDAWTGDKENDLGGPTCVTWVAPITDSGQSSWQKTYQTISVIAPIQAGTVTVTFTTDPNAPTSTTFTTPEIDLSTGPVTRNISIPQAQSRGYTAQVTVNFCTIADQQEPITIWGVGVWGKLDRQLTMWTVNG